MPLAVARAGPRVGPGRAEDRRHHGRPAPTSQPRPTTPPRMHRPSSRPNHRPPRGRPSRRPQAAVASPAPAANRGEQLWPRPRPSTPAATTRRPARWPTGQGRPARRRRPGRRADRPDRPGRAGRALSLYEAALDAVRKGEHASGPRPARPRSPPPATRSTRDSGPRSRTCSRSSRATAAGKPGTASTVDAAQDAETLAAQKLNAEVGTKIAEARRLSGDRPRQGHRASTSRPSRPSRRSGLPPELDPDDGPPPRGRHRAGQEGQGRLRRQDDRTRSSASEIEHKRLRILEADKAKKARDEGPDGQGHGGLRRGQVRRGRDLRQAGQEIDPNEVAAAILAFKARPSAASRPTSRTGRPRKRASSRASRTSTRGDRRPRGPAQRDQVRQELQGPDPRAAADEREARGQEGPQDAGDRGQAQRAGLAQHGQAAARRGRSSSSRTTPG